MSNSVIAQIGSFNTSLVQRSNVDPVKSYLEYKQVIRFDFYYSCAYCRLTEFEGGGERFVIDHYEPRRAKPDLVNVYDNLMWSCDTCNQRKGDRYPPDAARANGMRFFRPDQDMYGEHFSLVGEELTHKTNVGLYTIQSLDLNRPALKRVRRVRKDIFECQEAVAGGVMALLDFPIDRLPTNIRGPAMRAINQLRDAQDGIENTVDAILRDHARSHLLDEDDEASERNKQRKQKLKEIEGLFPGEWRGPRQQAKK